jgi:imidazole glycerol-phosphate synthase subunit HisF
MLTCLPRIIARLDVKGPDLVKGVHLEGLRVLGTPNSFARAYYEDGIDEIFYQDVVASLYQRNRLDSIIKSVAKDVFVPITVGGGIRTLADIKDVLRSGADKVAINTAAVLRPDFIREASETFGSSTIVVVIEAILQKDGRYLVSTDSAREIQDLDAKDWAEQVAALGAGEIVITAVEREGTGNGFDLSLTKMITESVNCPVIAHGGARTASDIKDVMVNTEASAVAIGSMLHYGALNLISNSEVKKHSGNTEFLKKNSGHSRFLETSVQTIKQNLLSMGVNCR